MFIRREARAFLRIFMPVDFRADKFRICHLIFQR